LLQLPIGDSEGGINIDDLKADQKNSRTKVTSPKPQDEEVPESAVVEVGATYPGGEAAILSHIAKNIKYPEIAIEREIQGVVTLRFKVEKDGSVSSVTVVGSLSPECDREAVRVVKTLHRFTPAKQQGQPVAVWYTLPVRYQIQ
jgi:protein TonB